MATARMRADLGKFLRIPWCAPDLRLTPEAARELDLFARQPPATTTFARLPSPASAGSGAQAYITDATLAYTGANIGAVAVGGGTHHAPVRVVNGAWVIG